VFDLKSNGLRPDGWTSSDAAGLAVLPLLMRYEEVAAGEVRHAVRFTARQTQRAYVWPARHFASSISDANVPPMGARFRLKRSFDASGFSPSIQVILRGLKQYGLILADNGSDWFLNGAPDERWDNDALRELRRLKGSDFEAVDVSALMVHRDSGQARGAGAAAAAVLHAASLQPGPLAPGLIVSIFGAGLGPAEGAALQLDASGRVATTIGGTRVFFDEAAAPLTYARSDQVNAIVPYAMAGRASAALVVEFQGSRTQPLQVEFADAAPAVFTLQASGSGQGAILNQDFTINLAANPAAKGSVVMLYATGEGQTDPPVADGGIAPGASWRPQLRVEVRISGEPAPVEYAGAAPGLVAGVLQVNARIPLSLASAGDLPVELTVGSRSSPSGVTIAVR
jgi:uncharacterized protein (TIGR03437 family)